jgi:hypothetical protein
VHEARRGQESLPEGPGSVPGNVPGKGAPRLQACRYGKVSLDHCMRAPPHLCAPPLHLAPTSHPPTPSPRSFTCPSPPLHLCAPSLHLP